MFYHHVINFESQTGSQLYACCPFHREKTPSFTVNEDSEEWYCHGCKKGGKLVDFIELFYDVPLDVARNIEKHYNQKMQILIPSEMTLEYWHSELMDRPSELKVLEEFGITRDTVEKFNLGWNDYRIMIPIPSRRGMVVNVRRYLPPHRRIEGMKNFKCLPITGLGSLRFFPYSAFEKEEIWIVEGEKDCLAAISQGLNAVTGTSGSNIPMKELGLLKDKIVYIMVDSDSVGADLRGKYNTMLKSIAKEVHNIFLPEKDFSDYWQAHHDTDLLKYEKAYEVIEEEKRASRSVSKQLTLLKSEFTENINSLMELKDISVIGTDPKVYSVPIKLRARCTNKNCKQPCTLMAEPIVWDTDPRNILQFIDSPDSVQDSVLRKLVGCRHIIAEPMELVNAQKFMFQEAASFIDGIEESSFEARYGIFLYNDYRLMPTLKYDFSCFRVTDPRDQQSYYVVREATRVDQKIENDNLDFLDFFRNIDTECTSVTELMNKHYEYWLPSLGIEGRADLFMAILLTMLSVTEINWKGGVVKGWLDTMVIGDTRTGKSQMAQRMIKTLGLGAYINGENAKRTGIIGGVQKFGDSWVVTWGAIPMNDKGMLTVDEASGLPVEDFKELSSARSSGAVTINKIVKSEARARTRLLWMGNPRSGRNIEDFYWRGYGAFLEFIPVAEDQARFDLVISAAREDISQLSGFDYEQKDISSYISLIRFAWSLGPNDIIISRATADAVAERAIYLEGEYGGGPLVVGVAVHEKLLRLSAAIAILCGSVFEDRVDILPQHVMYATEFLESTFSKHSFGYGEYIRELKKATLKRRENTDFVRSLVVLHPALKVLLASNVFRGMQVQEILGIDKGDAAKILSQLLQRGLLKVTNSAAYQPDRLLVDIVKQMEV